MNKVLGRRNILFEHREAGCPEGATVNPFMPTGAPNICCPRDAVSRTANVERTGWHKWVKWDNRGCVTWFSLTQSVTVDSQLYVE